MHIGLVIYGSLDTLSGGYLYDRMLVDRLKTAGDQVEIISLPWRNYLSHLADNFSPGFYRYVSRLNLDILVQDELNHPSLWRTNQLLKRETFCPIVSIVHHLRCSEARPDWQNRLYGWVEGQYLASVDAFIFNSQTTRRVVENLRSAGKPCVVAYPAGDRLHPEISDEQIMARAVEPGPLRIFFLGNLIPRKGLHTLLQALAGLPRDSFRLVVAGNLEMDRGYSKAVLHQVRSAGLEGQVQFLGPLRDAELVEQFVVNQVLVVPSSYEGFGIAYLEGMGFGIPAIASTLGAAWEIITHGKNGYLVALEDSKELSQRLLQLNDDRDLLTRLSLGARKRFTEHPTWEESTGLMHDFLVKLLR